MKKLIYISIILFYVFLFNTSIVLGQQTHNNDTLKNRYRFFDVRARGGSYVYSGSSMKDAFKNSFTSLEMRLGWQTNKEDGWQSRYLYPTYGVGWYIGFLNGSDFFGTPTALYGFIDFPVSRQKRNNFNLGLSLGLTYRLNPYVPSANARIDSAGSKLAVYFNLNFNWVYKLNREIDLLYGIDLTHYSNGRTVIPNYGIHLYGLNLGVRYHYNRAQKHADTDKVYPQNIIAARPERHNYNKILKTKEHVLELYQAFGTCQNKTDTGSSGRFFSSSTVLDYAYRYSELGRINAGFDYFIDGSTVAYLKPNENTIGNKSYFGIHAGYDFSFWHLMVRLQVGTYFKQGTVNKGYFYMRPSVRWEFPNRLFFAQVGLKTLNGAVADWIEYGMGLRLNKKK